MVEYIAQYCGRWSRPSFTGSTRLCSCGLLSKLASFCITQLLLQAYESKQLDLFTVDVPEGIADKGSEALMCFIL